MPQEFAIDEIGTVELRELVKSNVLTKEASSAVVNKLAKYRQESKVKVAALNVFLNMVDQKDIEPFVKKFKKMDTENTGFITAKQLAETFSEKNIEKQDSEIAKIISSIDLNGN